MCICINYIQHVRMRMLQIHICECIHDHTGANREAFPGSHVSRASVARLHIAVMSLVILGYAHQHPLLFTSHRASEASP